MTETPIQRLKTFLKQEERIANKAMEYSKRNIYRKIIKECDDLILLEKEMLITEIKEAFDTATEINDHTESWLRANKKSISLEEYLKLKQLL